MKIKTTVAVSMLGGILTTVAILLTLSAASERAMSARVDEELRQTAIDKCAASTRGVLSMLRSQHELLSLSLESSLSVAREEVSDAGGIRFSEERVPWSATNQFSKQTSEIQLPKMLAGETWLGQNASMGERTPVVDNVLDLVGGTCTIFQRMNDDGDMLRVATNVVKTDGSRAIGTYIPARNPDGVPNAVISTVLKGETFRGRAFVVDRWYVTAYEPITNDQGEVTGVLYFGVPMESVESVRQAIMETPVGKTGYVYVLGGSGSQQGDYIISNQGKRDGENIWEAKDADGNLFIQSVVENGKKVGDSGMHVEWYPWQNPGESEARLKVATVQYFEPWDWVVGSSAYLDDFMDAQARLNSVAAASVRNSIIAGVILCAIGVFVALFIAGRITSRINNVTKGLTSMAGGDGDLTKRLAETGRDEVTDLAKAFNGFVAGLADLIRDISKATDTVSQSAERVGEHGLEIEKAMGEQTSEAREISAQMSQLNDAITVIAERCNAAADGSRQSGADAAIGSQLVQDTADGIHQIAEVVSESTKAISDLGQRGEQIGEIIAVINDIADQTNLLALNAAIEAARAGEHGRGFAVVADEVRKLAERTTGATEEIGQSISMIREGTSRAVQGIESGAKSVEEGTSRAQAAGEKISEIVSGSAGVEQLIGEIATAAEEQSSTSDLVARNVERGTELSERCAGLVAQSRQDSDRMVEGARTLSSLVGRFKTEA
ncbi:MAG: methyl-accepting chemotaxis protein [Planctomycetota bacterium]